MKMNVEKLDELLKLTKDKDFQIIGLTEKIRCLEKKVETQKMQAEKEKEVANYWKEQYAVVMDRYIALQVKLSEVLPDEKR